jgi:hypothetical protein
LVAEDAADMDRIFLTIVLNLSFSVIFFAFSILFTIMNLCGCLKYKKCGTISAFIIYLISHIPLITVLAKLLNDLQYFNIQKLNFYIDNNCSDDFLIYSITKVRD